MADKYIELVEVSVFNRGKIIPVSTYRNIKRDYEAYTSLFMFEEEVVDYVKNNISEKTKKPSIEGYIGKCQASYLWLDIDIGGDMKAATNKMIEIVNKIQEKYEVSYRSLNIFFSGNKGYHIGIPTKIFGAAEYQSDILPKVFKTMARAICDNTSGVDYVIYNTSRLFRAPYSKHSKTGYYKIPIDFQRLVEGDLDFMIEMSAACNEHRTYALIYDYSDKLNKLFTDTVTTEISNIDIYEDNEGYQTAINLSSNSSIFRLPQNGERNDLIYKMSYRLFNMPLKVNEVSDLMKFIYEIVNEYSVKKGWPRYSEMEFRISINSAYSRTRLKPVQSIKANDFTDMVVSIYKAIKESQYVKTFMHDISEDLRGGWRFGDFYSFIGKGGTMKSYLLQEEIIRTAIDFEKPAMYFNLEMSKITWFERIWLAIFKQDLVKMINTGHINEGNINNLAIEIKDKMKRNLHYYGETDIDSEVIQSIIENTEKEIKEKIHIVGIDSVSGLKMYGDSEAITAVKHSKYLKEAAKKTNTPIISINHATNICPPTLRDCSPNVRGGSKYIDNCDAYLSLSSVVDKDLSNFEKNPPDLIFKQGVKYMRFVNKRGSGNTINKIIQFDGSGRIITLEDNPADFEVSSYTSGGYSYNIQG